MARLYTTRVIGVWSLGRSSYAGQVSKTAALWFEIALGGVSLVLLGSAIFALVLCVRRSLARAQTIAARTLWISVLTAMLATCVVLLARTVTDHGSPSGDASATARVVAESVSHGTNTTLPATLAFVVAIAAWVVAVLAGSRPARDE
jgi:hypothetical protein